MRHDRMRANSDYPSSQTRRGTYPPPSEYKGESANREQVFSVWVGGLRRLPLGKTRLRATDISQGREVTPERGLKNRASAHAHSYPSFLGACSW